MIHSTLNDYCMLHIFSLLSPVDLLNVEKVCRDWNNLAQKSWGDIKKIDDSTMDEEMLIEVIERCGGSIEEFQNEIDLRNTRIYAAIAQSCPNIQTLKLLFLNQHNENLMPLLHRYNKLKYISLETMYRIDDNTLTKLFINNPGLEVVNLPYGFKYKICLKYLPTTVKILRIMSVRNLSLEHFISCLIRCKSLHTLSIIDSLCCINWSSDCLNSISQVAPNLIQLSIRFMDVSLASLNHFNHLKRLFLFDIKMDDEILQSVCQSCTLLEVLGVGGRHNKLTRRGLTCIIHLRNLRELVLSCIDAKNVKESEDIIWFPSSLRVLRIYYSAIFTDKVALWVLRSCKNLEILSIDECCVTEEMVKNAIKILNKQTNRKTMLFLEIYNCNIDLKSAQDYKHRLFLIRNGSVTKRINSITSHYVMYQD